MSRVGPPSHAAIGIGLLVSLVAAVVVFVFSIFFSLFLLYTFLRHSIAEMRCMYIMLWLHFHISFSYLSSRC